ncbi:MAG TPA: aldo/keto reductase [Phycisphaerales bacterium]|nr:aldo/keto reductase [Phycisphaerales bacterium]
MEEQNKIDRRNFLKAMGATGLSSVLASSEIIAGPNEPNAPGKMQKTNFPQVPRRKLGKTGVDVPCLSLGGGFNLIENQIILKKALRWAVNYWDTTPDYAGGNSELGIGKFLSNNPKARKELFIVTKASGAKSVADVESRLQASLKRMNTKYIDLYYGSYMMSDPALLTDELKQWAESAKKRKLIRFFGFSTHKNMTQCLTAAAKLDWIDAIMTSYNFRLMQDAKMQDAIEACHKAGIGLIAIKTQGQGQGRRVKTKEDKKLLRHFLQRGFTEGQAKVKAVLEDERFSSACVGMENVAILTSNVAAVLDKTKFSQADMEIFKQYAASSCGSYCAGCAHICDSALPDAPYVSDIMRYLMYYNNYGQQDRARELFAQIPDRVKNKLLNIDYGLAEARCPQRMPIGRLVAEAVSKLA